MSDNSTSTTNTNLPTFEQAFPSQPQKEPAPTASLPTFEQAYPSGPQSASPPITQTDPTPWLASVLTSIANGNPVDNMVNSAVSQLPDIANKLSQTAGSAVAGKLGEMIPNHPAIGAAAGTLISMAPDIATAASGMGALEAGKEGLPAIARGLLTSPSELGPEIEAGEQVAGIDTDILPVRRGTIPKFPGLDGLPTNTPPPQAPTVTPLVYPKDTSTFLNFARSRVDGLGEQLQPQELADYRTILNDMIQGGEVKAGTKPYAKASQLYSDTNSLFTQAVAGREDLNEVYKYAKMIPSIGDAISTATKKYGPPVIKGIMGAAGAAAGWEGIKHLF